MTRLNLKWCFLVAACSTCGFFFLLSPAIAQTENRASKIATDAQIASMVKFAELAKASGNLDNAANLLGIAMNMSSADDAKLKQTFLIALQYAESLEAIDANSEAVCLYNLISTAAPESIFPFKRASLFQELDWDSAMLSELRVAHRLDPKHLDTVGGLATELLLVEQPKLRNVAEALEVSLSARDQIEQEPLIANAIAMAAAASKDFDLAVKMQTKYLASGAVSQADLLFENRNLDRYSAQTEAPPRRLPVFEPEDLLSNNSIANIALRSMVGVRVQGVVEGKDTKSGTVKVLASTRWAVGTVLDSFGTFLLSSESVRVPTYGELFVADTQNVERKPGDFSTEAKLRDALGSTRWLETPEIEIYSMPLPNVQSKLIGKAVIMGTDEASGLAVIELVRESAFGFVRHSEWKPAKFMPEYRALDPNAAQLVSGLELNYTPTDYITVPNLVMHKSCEPTVLAYYDRPSGAANKARFIPVRGSQSQPGSALFNQLGEIVGIKHQVDAPATDGQFAIPADVCTRIAAKLATYGEVRRAYLPFVVTSKTTGVKEPAMGMKVSQVPPSVSVYQPLQNKLIVSLDGVPTPTLTEWLTASERIHDRGLETALVEVYDPELNVVSWMTLPAQAPTVILAAPDDHPPANELETTKAPSSTEPTGTPGTDFFLSNAEQFASEHNLNGVIGSLRSALEYHQAEGWSPEKTRKIVLIYANALYDNQEYATCRHVIDSLLKSFPDTLEASVLRSAVYDKLRWDIAMLDEMRTILRLAPDFAAIRRGLALNLVYSHDISQRNAKEALTWLDPLEDSIDEEPLLARLIAMAAADTGDFDRATRLQKRYLDSGKVTAADRGVEDGLLAIYQQKLQAPKLPLPTFDDQELLDDAALEEVARKSMVIVKVRGDFSCTGAATGQTHVRRIEHQHIGTVLDIMGTFLVSAETVRLPQFAEIKELKGNGTTAWQRGPLIEVYSLPVNSKPGDVKESKLLGKAKLVGLDHATGLGVIELERPTEFHFTGIGTVEAPSKFMPAFRTISPEPKLAEAFEVSVQASDQFKQPKFRELKELALEPRVYDDFYAQNPMTSMMINLVDDQSPIGTPLFNRLGECVGIRHQVEWFDKTRNVAIPAAVCTRVAAKLAAYGDVPRMYCPFKIFPVKQPIKMVTGEKKEVMGIMVHEYPELAAYEGLGDKVIVSVDGHATPTLTEWLIAMERAYAMGSESISIEVLNWQSGEKSTMVIPAREPAQAKALKTELKTEAVIDSRKAIEQASQWIATNVNVDREVLDDLIQKFDRMLRADKNVACYFGSDVVKNGQFYSLLIRDGEVITNQLSSRAAKLLQLDPKKGAVMEFSKSVAKQRNTVELSGLKLGHKNVDGQEPFIDVSADLRSIDHETENLSLRVQFVAPDRLPIVVSLTGRPEADKKTQISMTMPTSDDNRSGPLGGLVVVDLVVNSGNLENPEYRSVSNQMVDYAELLAPEVTDMFLTLMEASQEADDKQ